LVVGSYVLSKGVSLNLEFDHCEWSATDVPGAKLLSSVAAGGSITALGSRGGIYVLQTVITTPTMLLPNGIYHSAQDGYRIYTRFAMAQTANCLFAVGVCDMPAAPAPLSAWYTANGIAIVQDDAIGANYLLRQVRAGAVVDIDSGIAVVAGEYHRFDLIVSTAGVPTMYIDGTLRATGAAANSPLTNTLMGPIMFSENLGAAVNAQLCMDSYKIVQSTNQTVTP
jgi:hypothetical protein